MSDYSELERRAQAAIDAIGTLSRARQEREFNDVCTPQVVKALIAENKRLLKLLERTVDQHVPLTELEGAPGWSRVVELVEVVAERDQLRAEVVGLNADNEALRNALTDCSDSLHGEMLQKFGGQLPDDMHPVTRREYDRDMGEVAGYRVALGKGEQS